MSLVTFADVVHQSISFSRSLPSQALIVDLIDNRWMQRLRDISQTANTRLVYMFSEHSRFGHSLGVAYLAHMLMDKLAADFPDEINKYRTAVGAAALLHDIGHLAPGSHTAFKSWFPDQPDTHEDIAINLVLHDKELHETIRTYGDDLPQTICDILLESQALPPWTWEIISGGGWNADRGNWCIVDSILAGVSYGKYNIPALTGSITLTNDKHLALNESRLDAMMHFAVSRHAMYRQVYQHRVILATDVLNRVIIQRARDQMNSLPFADNTMLAALEAKLPSHLKPDIIFAMRESWWRYHLARWMTGSDKTLADLSRRLIERDLFKTVRVSEQDNTAAFRKEAAIAVEKAGYDPRYYLNEISTEDVHGGDQLQSMYVLHDSGKVMRLHESEPLYGALVRESKASKKTWLVMPAEAKEILGRSR